MSDAPVVLSDQTHHFISSQTWDVAVLPFGATEPHGYHMPYGTDVFQCDAIGKRACQRAYDNGAKVLLLPTVPFGCNTNHMKIPGGLAMSLTPTTLLKILADIVDSLERQGVKKLVILNGHGGNEFKPLIRELFHRTSVFICLCDWFRVAPDVSRQLFENQGDHADEMETSMGLTLFPHLMRMELMGKGTQMPPRFDAIAKGWITVVRPWHAACPDTGAGDPSKGSKEKGDKYLAVIEERLANFLVDLANTPLDDKFPY